VSKKEDLLLALEEARERHARAVLRFRRYRVLEPPRETALAFKEAVDALWDYEHSREAAADDFMKCARVLRRSRASLGQTGQRATGAGA
jgi:hypothetical protein